MIPYDLLIALGSIVLGLSPIPGLLNKKSQFPRKSSLITAGVLTYFIPLFYLSGLTTTAATLCLQASVWWGIFVFRPIKEIKP